VSAAAAANSGSALASSECAVSTVGTPAREDAAAVRKASGDQVEAWTWTTSNLSASTALRPDQLVS
jgi:hypothetical protein